MSDKGFYPLPPSLAALRERYRKQGFLLSGEKTKKFEREFTIGRRWCALHAHLSREGGWDIMTANGHVKTPWLLIGRERVLLPDSDTILKATSIIVGPLAVIFACIKESS